MDSLRSPLTPDVRRGCAAQSSALTVHCLQQASSRTDTQHLNVAGSQRYPLTSRAPVVVRKAPASFRPLPQTHQRASNTVDGSPTLARRPPRSRGHGIPFSSWCPVPSPQAQPTHAHGIETHRAARNAQLHTTGGVRPSITSSAHLRDRPGLSLALRRPRASSTRPASIRPRLTPACSGLAALATDARR